jgi:hypothetical protein
LYLSIHPNHTFVHSVCLVLHKGFWPWAITDSPDLPVTWNNSYHPLKENAHVEFLHEQQDIEVQLAIIWAQSPSRNVQSLMTSICMFWSILTHNSPQVEYYAKTYRRLW